MLQNRRMLSKQEQVGRFADDGTRLRRRTCTSPRPASRYQHKSRPQAADPWWSGTPAPDREVGPLYVQALVNVTKDCLSKSGVGRSVFRGSKWLTLGSCVACCSLALFWNSLHIEDENQGSRFHCFQIVHYIDNCLHTNRCCCKLNSAIAQLLTTSACDCLSCILIWYCCSDERR